MSDELDPKNSLVVRVVVLLLGLLFLGLTVVAAIRLNWIALVTLGASVYLLWSWWGAHLASRGPAWPANVPRLYPQLDGVQLCEFMAAEQFERIRRLPIVSVLPFASDDSSPEEVVFGRGLQLLMIRDLMLVPNLSVHGPEDIPVVLLETARELAEEDQRSIFVSGRASRDATGFRLDLHVRKPGEKWAKGMIASVQFGDFLIKCAASIAKALGGQVDQTVLERWRVGRPSSAESLEEFGRLQLALEDEPQEQSQAMVQLAQRDPGFGLPLASIDTDFPGALNYLLEAHRRDPFDAQLCFSLFCTVWQSRGWEPAAMQFARRAIELSPGHGKAHMCAPHAAHPDAKMLCHSELGYRLLPGNTFAVNNYILNLTQSGAPPEKLMELAQEGIDNDPSDPGNYERLIEMHCQKWEFREALTVAERLQTLYEPKMNERTLYCLKQNPRRAKWLEAGQYDPAYENRKRIAELREKCGRL